MSEIPVEDAADLLDEIHGHRRTIRELRRELAAQDVTIETGYALIETRDRVIARLLNGYEPHPDRNKQGWWRPGSPERPEMSDDEAVIIRAHDPSRT